jgi:Alginate export
MRVGSAQSFGIERTGDLMNRMFVGSLMLASFAFTSAALFAQQQPRISSQASSDASSTTLLVQPGGSRDFQEQLSSAKPEAAMPTMAPTNAATATATAHATPPPVSSHKLGALTVSGTWRVRAEAWDFFQPTIGQPTYGFEHSLLRVGIGQKRESFEWFLEGAADAIVQLPTAAVQPGRAGQLGLGGTYYAANGNARNNVNGFVKQAYVGFHLPGKGNLRLGRFTYLDGAEVQPKDKTLAALINTRVAQRLIGDFGFSAVQRSFDGAQASFNLGKSNFTFFGARPTKGVFQSDALGELDIDVFYGAYTLSLNSAKNVGSLRIFGVGYLDNRDGVLKTDNRSVAARTTDTQHIDIATYGADYAHVLRTSRAGQFDGLAWVALQNGSWGLLPHRAEAFAGELGWQPPVSTIHPWFSGGYSFGSGDSNGNDDEHHTFFQLLTTPRVYARFPFYNMMNNEDFYGSAAFRLPHSLAVRSEVHALRLVSAQDFWYAGGGAFQPKTFGYIGRASGGDRSLANILDASLDIPLPYRFSVTTYYAHAWGKSVMASIFPGGTNAQFGYVEMNYRF